MEVVKIKARISKDLELHWPMYLCLSIFMTVSIVIGILAYALIINKPERNDDSGTHPIKVNVYLNSNDTIVYSISSEIKELKNMMQRMQGDSLCITITKGKSDV